MYQQAALVLTQRRLLDEVGGESSPVVVASDLDETIGSRRLC